MEKRKVIIATKQCGGYTTHCQLHGEATEHPPYTHVKFNIDGGKVVHINLFENASNIQALDAIENMLDIKIDDLRVEFVRWENFNLLNKAPVMLSLPSDEEIDNFDLSKYPHMTQQGAVLIRWGMTVMRDEIRNRMQGNGA